MVEREFKRLELNEEIQPATSLANLAGVVCRFLLFWMLFCPSSATGQWKKLLSDYTQFRVIYFIDLPGPPRIGFAAGTNYPGHLFKTTDGGITWKSVLLPASDYTITDITFKDSTTGWLSIFGDPIGASCYMTTDAGDSWFPLAGSARTFGSGLFYNQKKNLLLLSSWSIPSLISSDEGQTWQQLLPFSALRNGFAFFDSINGLNASFESWLKTTDGGATWNSLNFGLESWQPMSLVNTNTFFALSDLTETVYRSIDAGNAWSPIYTFSDNQSNYANSIASSGCIRGDSCHLFALLGSGCYLSTDQGMTWSNLGDPQPAYLVDDSRFYTKNGYLYIMRDSGGPNNSIWELNYGSSLPIIGISSRLDNGTQQTTLHPGDSVGITFVPGAGTLAATDSVSLTLRYDPNAVDVRGTSLQVGTGWWIADSSTTCTPDGTWCMLALTLRADSAESLPDPLLHAEFHTYLTPSEDHPLPAPSKGGGISTFIYLDSAQSYFPQTTPCAATVLSLDSPDSVEIDFTGCGDSTLVAAMQGQPLFTITSIVPNPARTSLTVTVSGVREPGSGIECELFDALGNSVLTQHSAHFDLLRAGVSTQNLDVASLPSGIYFLRLSENGYVQSRQISIEH